MPDDQEARRERADRLRKQIEQLKTPKEDDSPEQKPGETPREYVERREREIARKKPDGK